LPKEFEDLLKKTVLFKVQSRNQDNFRFEQSFRVKKLCTDQLIIHKYVEGLMKPQVYTLLLMFMIYYFINILMFLFWNLFFYYLFGLKDVFSELENLSTRKDVKNVDCVAVAEVCIVE